MSEDRTQALEEEEKHGSDLEGAKNQNTRREIVSYRRQLVYNTISGTMTENTFPVYKVDAIVTFFRTEVLTGQEAKHFTKNDLAPSPKPDAVQRLYMRILQLLYRFKPECHYMVPFSENIQHPQLHEWPTAVMSVYLRMRQFLRMCYVYDFSLNDLLAPKVKRTVTILSGIMNYLHFRKQRLDMTMGHQERFREDMDKLQAYSRGTKDAQNRKKEWTDVALEADVTIPPEQQAEARELDSALSDLQTNTMHQYQEVNAINENIAEWKTEMAEKSQKLTQLKVDVATLKENIGKLKSQIVESPEEMKIQMEKMKENVKNIKLAIETADERLVGLQGNVQGVTHSEAEIQLMFKLLQDLQSSMNKTQQHQEEKREQIADQIQEIDRETQHHRSQVTTLRDACSQETEKAQDLFDRLLAALEHFHKRIQNHIVEGNNDIVKMTANF
ncbi:hypothetical protein J4Q44_G00098630 [Coregonus suidteri]|uniref:Kinetochore protein Nuf2 N-terminal domain-containing protein n=1 Tax=Coregonus suidteri TaxID=861788 RepID=A0AAN8R9F6_9TELE